MAARTYRSRSLEVDAGPGPERLAARRPAAARRACVAVLTSLAAAAVLQIAASLALPTMLPEAIDADYGGRLLRVRHGRAADPKRTVTIVMLGSSRTYYGLEADSLNAPLARELGRPVSVVNFGFTGGGSFRNLLYYRRLRHEGVRPDLLLIEVIPQHLGDASPRHEMREEGMPANRLEWLDLPVLERYRDGSRPGLWRDVAWVEATTAYSRRVGVLHAVAPALLSPPESKDACVVERLSPPPFPVDPPQDSRDAAREAARKGWAPGLNYYQPGGRGADALLELLRLCRQEGVPAALVLMPEGPVFRSWYPPGTWERMQVWLSGVSRGEQVPVINAHEWVDEDGFIDSHHLLRRGAAKFTERLGREYLLPMLRRPAEFAAGPAPPIP